MPISKYMQEEILNAYTVQLVANNDAKLTKLADAVDERVRAVYAKHVDPVVVALKAIPGYEVKFRSGGGFLIGRKPKKDAEDSGEQFVKMNLVNRLSLSGERRHSSFGWQKSNTERFTLPEHIRLRTDYQNDHDALTVQIPDRTYQSYKKALRAFNAEALRLDKVRQQVASLLSVSPSIKSLRKAWPEGAPFLPGTVEGRGLVVIPSEINDAAGLPVGE